MLLEFSVAGYMSFGSLETIVFSAFDKQRIKSTRYESNYMLDTPFREAKSVLVFGNNATGKTNLILAIQDYLNIIKTGKLIRNGKLFNLHAEDMTFKGTVSTASGDAPHYFTYSINFSKMGEVLKEELLKDDECIFAFDNEKLTSEYIKLEVCTIYSRPSTGALLDKLRDFIPEVYQEFIACIDSIEVHTDVAISDKHSEILLDDYSKTLIEANKELSLEILHSIDNTIEDIGFVPVRSTDETVLYDALISRKQNDGVVNEYSLQMEAKGVKKIVNLLKAFLHLYDGRVILVDELDSSISTKSLILLYNRIVNSEENKRGQLVVTSHNLSLLTLSMFAPEQLYVAVKDDMTWTRLYSLAEFDLRSNKKNLEKIYLEGGFEK